MQKDVRYYRPASHFDLPSAGDIWGNLKAGAENIRLAISGHPIDAITQSAIQKAVQDTGKKPTVTAAAKLTSTATIQKIQEKSAENVTDTIGSIFSGFKWVVIGVVAVLLIVLLKK